MTSPLGERIARRISHLGPMTLADYMAEALTDPTEGYYSGADPLGARGDFTTAPEISQMFGELIGLWCVETWRAMERPDPVHLVELGPGRGTLLCDALRAARLAPDFLEALDIHLVEISSALRQKQEAALRGWPVTWHDSLAAVPPGPMILLANEYLDALPVRQFEWGREGWCERLVTLAADGRGLALGLAPPGAAARHLVPAHLSRSGFAATPGAVVEICPAAEGLCLDLARRIAGDGGVALIIDYGSEEPSGQPTLQALKAHRRLDILDQPGQADLTAHVDFAALVRAADAGGAITHGPVDQGDFLRALGIEPRARSLHRAASAAQAENIRAALERLTQPEQMGELFKVLAIAQPGLDRLAGFM